MRQNFLFSVYVFLLVSSAFPSHSLAAGEGDNGNTNTSNNQTSPTSDVTTNSNPFNPSNNSNSAFNSSFSSSFNSSFASQCGLSSSLGYTSNGNYQMMVTWNSNPCTNQRELEEIRQNFELQREVVKASSQIINTCIQSRAQAALKSINPDTICMLSQFQIPKSKQN